MKDVRKVVAAGRCLKVGAERLPQGTPVDGLLPEEELASLEAGGWIEDSVVAAAPAPAPARTSGELGVSPDPWGLDPDGLKGKSLQDLNLYIVERGAPPCPTVEAAIALLSKDYTPPEA